MRKTLKNPWFLGFLTLALSAGAANASLVTSIPGGTVINMPVVNYFGGGPQTVVPGVTWASTNASKEGGSVFGYTGRYLFSGNGGWDGTLGPMAGLDDSYFSDSVVDTMTFSFSAPVSAVGGFLNYAPGHGSPTIAVYNSVGGLIESDQLAFSTGGGTNTGRFLGFQESGAIISSFTLTDSYIGITDLTTSATAAPEPSLYILMAAGMLGLFAAARRRMVSSRQV